MQFGRGLAGIVGVAVIGVVALIYFGLDGKEREEAPPEVLGARGSEAMDPSSPAGAGTRESRLAAAREKDPGAAWGRPDRDADAPAGETIPYEEGSSRAAAERLGTEGRTAAGARAPRPGERTPDRPESDADRAAIDAFLRAASEAAGRDVAPRDDGAAPKKPGERYEPPGDASDPRLEGVSVGSPATITCASAPGICSMFPFAMSLPGAIPVVSDGTEAVQLPVAGGPDIVWIRTADGIIQVSTNNLTNAGQLAAVVDRFRPRP